MLLDELVDIPLLQQMTDEGYIRVQRHPELPLMIYNYTEKAQFARRWNQATLTCRGLIVNFRTREVIARPFPKFFNYGEDQSSQSFEDYRSSRVIVTDKLDGSLGIVYPAGDAWAVATRGSFTSPQALHATQRLQEYLRHWQPDPGVTHLCEIIYPGNRIVCDYGDMDELVLLGTVSIDYGYTAGPFDEAWPGPRAKVFSYATFEDALAARPREGAEGLVVHFPERDMRLKLKQADYVALHRVVTGLNERAVWELMQEGKSCAEVCEGLPDDFHPFVSRVYAELNGQWYGIYYAAKDDYDALIRRLPAGFSRKDFALAVKDGAQYPMWLLFLLLDGKDIGSAVWKLIRPGYTRGPWARSEDNA